MTNRPDGRPNLDLLAQCNGCGGAMTEQDGRYACPASPVDARLLLWAIFSALLRLIINDEAIDQVARTVRLTIEPRAWTLRRELESAGPVLIGQSTPTDPMASPAVRRQLAALETIADEDAIRRDATDPAIFVDGGYEEAQELLDLMLDRVLVDPSHAIGIAYQMPMPGDRPGQWVTEDRTALQPALPAWTEAR